MGEEVENSPQIYNGVPPNANSREMEVAKLENSVVDPQHAYRILQEIQTTISRMESLQVENRDLALHTVSLLEPEEDSGEDSEEEYSEEEKKHATIPEEIDQQSTATRNTIWYSSAAVLAALFYTIFRRKSPSAVQQSIPKQKTPVLQKSLSREPFYME